MKEQKLRNDRAGHGIVYGSGKENDVFLEQARIDIIGAFAGDFDGSGKDQLIEAQYEGGKLFPLRGRSKLAYAFPWLPKKFRSAA